jgi:hypothetical protein
MNKEAKKALLQDRRNKLAQNGKENVGVLMRSKYCSVKNKILCILLLTRMVRPVYKFFYRSHLN